MLRVVDAPAAIAARGFPAATSLSVPLRIADGARPANSGRWQLTVAGGAGALDPLDPDAPGRPRRPVPRRHAGRARAGRAVRRDAPRHAAPGGPGLGGTPGDDAALDAAFAATPYMLDAF